MEQLSFTDAMLLHLLGIALTGKENRTFSAEELNGVDWDAVLTESHHQAVPLLVLDAVGRYAKYIPAEVYDRWLRASVDFFEPNLQVTTGQEQLVNVLTQNGVAYVILKGAAAAVRYPRPDLRMMGDVDFLIDPACQTAVETLLLENGYRKIEMEHDCHVAFEKDGVEYEMHFQTAGIPAGKAGERVRAFMANVLQTAQVATVEGATFAAPDESHQALIFLLHMQQHTLGEGMGLRQLCDWLCFVRDTADMPFWKETVLPLLKEIGLYTYASVMTKLGALYLAMPCPDWVVADDGVCAAVMGDILASGNFGSKDETRSQSGRLISEHGKEGTRHGMVYHACRIMHRYVMKSYPVVRKIPVLYPFLFVYRVLRYLMLSVRGKRESLGRLTAAANQRKTVYEPLKIFEIE